MSNVIISALTVNLEHTLLLFKFMCFSFYLDIGDTLTTKSEHNTHVPLSYKSIKSNLEIPLILDFPMIPLNYCDCMRCLLFDSLYVSTVHYS